MSCALLEQPWITAALVVRGPSTLVLEHIGSLVETTHVSYHRVPLGFFAAAKSCHNDTGLAIFNSLLMSSFNPLMKNVIIVSLV